MAALLGADTKPIHRKARGGDIARSVADITKARSALGFKPKFPLEEGLSALIRGG